jgi:hypothetical protein
VLERSSTFFVIEWVQWNLSNRMDCGLLKFLKVHKMIKVDNEVAAIFG